MCSSQFSKLKSGMKSHPEVTLNRSSNAIGDDKTNFPHNLLLTNT